ncbi:energy transducer TonB [Leptospira mayottensis]|uniref:TonB-dependent receptor n=2 Tax=Leptospira mayottensis TaxID=1137606 RepID=A0AA87SXC3_9LEPT|nr:energy transducer TonB [Leptospira mayottensis]AXR62654.1 energy transducer TonB [Leptospira mayottensis]AXR66451.1 energy transducer TonB [Leptospira mayottensis]AXR70004.1 energy transducer TonB [Leptospira mayottensis]AZQ04037.1 energy transducer TonB [Leptospira mayottensis 200901116]EKS00051.1 TonB-dependent receptor [Leptospira mayottensis 200901122]
MVNVSEIKQKIIRFGLFRFCLIVSFTLHSLSIGIYFIATYIPDMEVSSEDLNTQDVEVDLEDIPPELIGGTSSPAPVEKQEWVEGSDKNADDPIDEDLNPNALSGNGTDKDGFLFSYNGDKTPTPIIDFDLRDFFPPQAKSAGIVTKQVVVIVQIDEQGNLQGAKVASGKAGFGFDEAALKIVKLARWSPGYVQGRPTKMSHRVPIHFNLED